MTVAPPASGSRGPAARRTPRDLGVWIVWHGLTAAGLVLGASHVRLRVPLWKVPPEHHLFLAGLVIAYGLAAGTVLWRASRPAGARLRDVLLAVALAFGGLAFLLVLTEGPESRSVLLAAVAASLVANCIPLPGVGRRAALALVALALASVTGLTALGVRLAAQRAMRSQVIATTFYDVALLVHEGVVPSAVFGGGVEPVGGGLLLATGDGRLHFAADLTSPATIDVRTLPYRIPVNHADFAGDTEDRVPKQNFRVADILARSWLDSLQLLASHHYWHRDRRCYALRMSSATAARAAFLAGTATVTWRTVFDTRPCMSLKADTAQAPFNGDEIGGRMVMLDTHSVLLTVGDMAFDGWNSAELLAQDPAGHYGKTVLVDLRDGSSELYSTGHRNPQGIVRSPEGRLWLTEHGPKGGDELNLLVRGANYGWPYVTLGADYEQLKWPLSANQGRHPGYQGPVYAWLPAIGVSNVIVLGGDRFALWKGDLLIASLGAATLFRVRVDGPRVEFAEPLRIGERIRDLTEAPDGRVYLLFDSGSLGVLAPLPAAGDTESSAYFTPATRGQLLFATCAGCHASDGRGTAPSLAGVVGRRVAGDRSYPYSPALRALGGTWTRDRLHAFLTDPAGLAPGTTMRFDPMRDSTERESVISYLRTLR